MIGSGHPTVHLNGTHLLTDTYTHEETADGDGTRRVFVADMGEMM